MAGGDEKLDRALARLRRFQKELEDLDARSTLSKWTIGVWIASGALGLGGIALAPFSGGASLLLSVAGFVVFLVDMAKQVADNAKTVAARERAEAILSGIRDELARIERRVVESAGEASESPPVSEAAEEGPEA